MTEEIDIKIKHKVMLPWYDTEGNKQWSILTFWGEIAYDTIYKHVKDFILHNFKRNVSTKWVKTFCPIIKEDEETEEDKARIQKAVEAFIERMELKDENEDGTHTSSEEGSTCKAERPLRIVQNQPK